MNQWETLLLCRPLLEPYLIDDVMGIILEYLQIPPDPPPNSSPGLGFKKSHLDHNIDQYNMYRYRVGVGEKLSFLGWMSTISRENIIILSKSSRPIVDIHPRNY